MEMMDCIEVTAEKEKYAQQGVHKGMQGWICDDEKAQGYLLVNFPGYGEADDIAEALILEEDLKLIPVMDARVSERIKAVYNSLEGAEMESKSTHDDVSVI